MSKLPICSLRTIQTAHRPFCTLTQGAVSEFLPLLCSAPHFCSTVLSRPRANTGMHSFGFTAYNECLEMAGGTETQVCLTHLHCTSLTDFSTQIPISPFNRSINECMAQTIKCYFFQVFLQGWANQTTSHDGICTFCSVRIHDRGLLRAELLHRFCSFSFFVLYIKLTCPISLKPSIPLPLHILQTFLSHLQMPVKAETMPVAVGSPSLENYWYKR